MYACEALPDQWFLEMPMKGKYEREITARVVYLTFKAVETCKACPVQSICLDEGMNEDYLEHGVWGGKLPAERLAASGLDGSPDQKEMLRLVNNYREESK